MRVAVGGALLFAVGCGRIGFEPVEAGAAPDALTPDGPPPAFAPPVVVAAISSSADDFGPTLTADGLALILASDRGGSFTLYHAPRPPAGEFAAPAEVTALASAGAEYDADVAESDLELYFVSTSTPAGLRRTSRASTSDPWGPPTIVALGADRLGPTLGAGDLRMLIALRNAGGIEEWVRTAATDIDWQLVRTHAALDGLTWPALSSDGLEVFAVDTARQLFRATRTSLDEPFGTAERYRFGSSLDDRPIFDPELSRDGTTLYLAIDVGGSSDIHVTTR